MLIRNSELLHWKFQQAYCDTFEVLSVNLSLKNILKPSTLTFLDNGWKGYVSGCFTERPTVRFTHCSSQNPKRKESERVRSEGTGIGAELTGKRLLRKLTKETRL